jgi:two-component system, OmpR family, sensor kinase
MSKAKGLALTVDKAGKILSVLYNDVGNQIAKDKLFPTILDQGEFIAGLNFLNRLKQEKMLVDIPLALTIKGKSRSFYFTGVIKDELYLLTASNNQGLDSSIYDEIAKVNNELANQLRESIKQNMKTSPVLNEPQLEEFTKINNELVNTQRALNKSNMKLEELNEQKNQLIGIAAHDLRNPLGVITGYIQFVIGTSTNLNDAQIQMLDKSISTAKKMTTMLEELLDMSELDSGKVVLNLKDVDLNDIIKENIELNQVIADAKNIKIHLLSSGPLAVRIDDSKVEQVISNFLSNAIKYSHPDTNIYVELNGDKKRVYVGVRDEGQGIPEDELKYVFEPFKTTSVKSTGGEKSTGLGLAITKKVIEAHNGSIGVKSKVGQGSEFYFQLPMNQID